MAFSNQNNLAAEKKKNHLTFSVSYVLHQAIYLHSCFCVGFMLQKSQKLAALCMELEDQVKDMEAIVADSENQEAQWNDMR